ncbi:GNAT family N-acetyltransferase [Celerinatantimonas sp. YJH-8]|uniref:GNAT family N-acetyltransferase n=1 Tax=Celerinatantimonas sp. YJH-8 TaxID=3228714 RepID=UPI0038CADBC0
MGPKIRSATLQDVQNILLLGRQTYKEHFGELWNNIDVFLDADFTQEQVIQDINSPEKHRYLLAFQDQVLMGFVKLNLNTLLAPHVDSGIELQKIYLRKSGTGQRLGAALMERVLQLAAELESPYIWLDVLKSNQSAQRFYQRYQFEIIDEIPYATDRYEIGMYVMLKS